MKRSEVRALLPRFRQLARDRVAQMERMPAFKAMREAASRRRRRALTAIALVLLALFFIDCDGPPGRKPLLAKATPVTRVTPTPKPKASPRRPLQAKLEPQKRPGYTLQAREAPDWLDDFRLQVAARSPRLAECFNGSERSGALRWTVSIDAKTGAVADHDFEALGSGADVGSAQKACATRALSDPGYRLENPSAETLPNRVSLVLEF